MYKVMIIDGHDRRALATVRSLGSKSDFRVYVGSSRKINGSRFSRYCDVFVQYPNPVSDKEKALSFLQQYLLTEKIDVLIPMDDSMAELIAANQERFKGSAKILIPEWSVFEIAHDKALTLQQAQKCGIPIPATYTFAQALEKDLRYPVIIKPRISSASIGMVVARSKKELISLYEKVSQTYDNPIIQEKIRSGGGHYQANMVFNRQSELVCSSIKNKLREFPLTGGPSTFFKTVDKPKIEQYALQLLKSINWVGPAEVEFMVDPEDGKAKLMEINPRMSATIVLSIHAGVDFPLHIVQSALNLPVAMPVRNNNFEYYCQWLIPGDFLNFVFNKNRFRQPHGYFCQKPSKLCHMTFDRRDPIPFLANTFALGCAALNPKKISKFVERG
jgi:predicted ATP-grasp superfamily ATP-dependent carboligase